SRSPIAPRTRKSRSTKPGSNCSPKNNLLRNSRPPNNWARWQCSCVRTPRRRCEVPRFRSTGDGSLNNQRGGLEMQTLPLRQAVEMIPDGAILMVGGFMGVGTPERVVDEIVRQKKRNLTIIANDTATPGVGVGKLVSAKSVRRAIVSHIGLNPETQQQMMAGEMTVELVPQGTLIERIRAGGCGLGGVLTQTGIGTVVEKDKQKIVLAGMEYLLETALKADFALVHAFLA